ncbi:MAG: hypothetical protein M1831_005954 [Alyxoria varia]|nr:MAG: hypothetical protein M1831_005954 [Alyxoria varia]
MTSRNVYSAAGDNDATFSAYNNPQEMLQLMRTVRGRLQGEVFFRNVYTDSPWSNSYCYINPETGSLRYEVESNDNVFGTLVDNLRGCKVRAAHDLATQTPFLQLKTKDGSTKLHLRPRNLSSFNNWFAALLCWQPLREEQNIQAATRQPNATSLISGPQDESKHESQTGHKEFDNENSAVKSDYVNMIERKPSARSSSSRSSNKSLDLFFCEAHCSLRSNGELSILNTTNNLKSATLQLPHLPRSAIQRLSKSVFGVDLVLAIYPQYAPSAQACSCSRPIFLSFDTKETYEVWFVLLRAFSYLELHGPHALRRMEQLNISDGNSGLDAKTASNLFRLERLLDFRINKAQVEPPKERKEQLSPNNARRAQPTLGQSAPAMPPSYYVEILVDEQVKARTAVKQQAREYVIWYETHVLEDLPSTVMSVTVRLKEIKNADESSMSSTDSGFSMNSFSSLTPGSNGATFGEVHIDPARLSGSVNIDDTFELKSPKGERVGEIQMKVTHEQDTIFMERSYRDVMFLLEDCQNALSIKLYNHLPTQSLRLSERLLDFYQATGQAKNWLQFLAKEEIVGSRNPSGLPDGDESQRDVKMPAGASKDKEDENSRTALLFRGNTLLSRALDLYMKRIGKTYLEQTLGPKLREVMEQEPECEIDPSRMIPGADAEKNLHNLSSVTEEIWQEIRNSAALCPTELRMIFRHIRNTVEQRMANSHPSAVYTSVSGFLFLRFFCAAVASPHMFGLVQESAGSPVNRTYMLVAKSLQSLANLTTFGNKEPWMAPMNHFCSANRTAFKEFIDEICDVQSNRRSLTVDPMTANYPMKALSAVYEGLPSPAREGFLLLPGLVDPTRNLAALVDMWLNHATNPKRSSTSSLDESLKNDSDLAFFHECCRKLRQKGGDSLSQVASTIASSSLGMPAISQQWALVAERMELNPENFWSTDPNGGNRPVSALSGDVDPGTSPPDGYMAGNYYANHQVVNSNKDQNSKSGFRLGLKSHKNRKHSPDDDTRRNAAIKSTTVSVSPDRPLLDNRNSMDSASSGGRSTNTTKSKKERKKSPPRNAEDNAMRKLGWM